MFRILSVDGAGARGILPAHVLWLFSNSFRVELPKVFDLIVGTSTGAIIAAAAAVGVGMDVVADMYETKSAQIFAKRRLSLGGLLGSKYSSGPLKELLATIFGDMTMSAARTRLMLPTTDISNGNVFVIKSPYLDSFVRDRDIRLVDAVLASCAAPSYFDPVRVGEYLLADGGNVFR